ncbi:uncharacterized protein TrAFT101_011754 [Trichoderma asperellum]|uniref:F-box domain-containing protein n=1 Tax=Trichoderma asperellum (strain ATCC 204424 / CBS 433.97 / NBRC 101777) TaxID=1042311 RepID=A0A2T3Z015_TRIA4|nr:hypothetical protein M441DRAFT_29539 [Trichoderma asperellum CBS 433.97]PTB38137.1 hypothetical protein M441DRAFT_29539 [Trichoderma asperellum CBS 433.97]UKZ96987.1 hypothetical protein TrAFT101_011754 [Trichoderma asperellum]
MTTITPIYNAISSIKTFTAVINITANYLLAIPVEHMGDRKQASVEPQNILHNYFSHGQDQHSDVIVARDIKRKASTEISKNDLLKKTDHEGQAEYFRSATLSGLPTDIILIIMDYVEFIEDIIGFRLVNKLLCSTVQKL